MEELQEKKELYEILISKVIEYINMEKAQYYLNNPNETESQIKTDFSVEYNTLFDLQIGLLLVFY